MNFFNIWWFLKIWRFLKICQLRKIWCFWNINWFFYLASFAYLVIFEISEILGISEILQKNWFKQDIFVNNWWNWGPIEIWLKCLLGTYQGTRIFKISPPIHLILTQYLQNTDSSKIFVNNGSTWLHFFVNLIILTFESAKMGKIFTDSLAFATLSSAHKWPRLAALSSG